MSKIRMHNDLQQLRYLLPALFTNISALVISVRYIKPELCLPLYVLTDIVIARLDTPKCIFIGSAVLYYVNCRQLLSVQLTAQMGIRKPPDHSDGLNSFNSFSLQ